MSVLEATDDSWAVTMFSFTSSLVRGERTPVQLIEDVVDAGLATTIEVDAPQHFATYPDFDAEEVEALRSVVARRGIRLSMMGVYNDAGSRRESAFTLEESVRYISRQLEVASELGFIGARIMFGLDPALLEKLAPEAERHGVPLWQEVQGGARPDGAEFERQREAIQRIGSDKLGFVFDLSACMAALPVTYLEALRREGVPNDVVQYLDDEWPTGETTRVRSGLDARLESLDLPPSAMLRLSMPFGRFGNSSVADWRDALGEFDAVHLKYWDVEDDDRRVSQPLADFRREFGAIGYTGVLTSEWGGHEWLDDDGFGMTRRHRALFDRAVD